MLRSVQDIPTFEILLRVARETDVPQKSELAEVLKYCHLTPGKQKKYLDSIFRTREIYSREGIHTYCLSNDLHPKLQPAV